MLISKATQASYFYINTTIQCVKYLFVSVCSKYGVKRTSVFEDDIATFKEESTPIEFSTATSLSSLTIDDEVKSSDYTKSGDKLEEISEPVHQNIEKGTSFVKVNVLEVEKQPEQISDGDEDDEDMLAACISMGMQNNRYSNYSVILIALLLLRQ